MNTVPTVFWAFLTVGGYLLGKDLDSALIGLLAGLGTSLLITIFK